MAEKMSIQERVQMASTKVQNNPYIGAISGGLMSALPVTIVGAFGSLLNGLPIPVYQDFLVNTGLKTLTSIPNEITNNMLALYVVFLIASKFAEAHKLDGTPAGMLSLMSFLIVTPFNISEAGTMESFSVQWFGAAGLFTAFIVALITAKVYTVFRIKGWIIKMPEGVPPTVSKSFSGLIPSLVLMVVWLAVRGIFLLTPFGDIHNFIFSMFAAPLTALGNTFIAMLIAIIVAHVLWLFGIHGMLIVISVMLPIWTPNAVENLAAFNAGEPIPNLISSSLFFQVPVMGSGATLGLALAMMRGKSERYKTLGKLAVIPNACGINEPIIFGTPMVMNFSLAIPFILTPTLIFIAAYVLSAIGVLPYLPGINAPLGTPIIIAGLISGGWRWALFQLGTVVLSYFVYKPAFNTMDKAAYEEEQKLKAQKAEDETIIPTVG